MKKLRIIILLTISAFILSLCGCSEKQITPPYIDRVYSPTPQISIYYPEISKSGYDTVNNVISSFAESVFDKNEFESTDGITVELTYSVTLFDESYISITFSGYWNNSTAAHPFDYFDALTVNLKTSETVRIDDLFDVDEAFLNTARREFRAQLPGALSERYSLSPGELQADINSLSLSDNNEALKNELLSEYPFFLTENSVRISVPLPHALGDHIEFFIFSVDLV